jgi:hypothetical protein
MGRLRTARRPHPWSLIDTATLEAVPGKKPLIKLSYRPPNYETPLSYFTSEFTPNDDCQSLENRLSSRQYGFYCGFDTPAHLSYGLVRARRACAPQSGEAVLAPTKFGTGNQCEIKLR